MKIMLDAGHYGKQNRSPAVPAYYESEGMWALHLYLKAALEAYGVTVGQTREDEGLDREVTARGKASKGYDLFLSLHSNAAGNIVNESVDYPVCYVSLNGSGDVLGEKLAQTVAEVMRTKQPGRTATREGENGDYYGVIRGAVAVGTPPVLIEHSFHTQTRATNWLLDENNLRRLAEAEAKTIAAHYGLAKPAPPEQDDREKEEESLTKEALFSYMDEWEALRNPTYNRLEDVPEYWREETAALLRGGYIKGDGTQELAMKRETLRAVIVAARVAGLA